MSIVLRTLFILGPSLSRSVSIVGASESFRTGIRLREERRDPPREGCFWTFSRVVHGVQLSEDEFKVTVDEVVIADAVLPVPTDEFFTVEEAFRSFVAWPRHLVGDVSNPPHIGQEGSPPPKKTHLSEDDPLGALDELAKIISDVPMNVHWDSTTFGREAQIPLYLHNQDVRELVSGREEINITLIQLWMMYMFDVSNKKGFNDVYGFIDPSMTHERNKFDDIQTYITTCFGMGKEIYLLPYIHGCHWQLLVISIPENTVVWFCSLQKTREYASIKAIPEAKAEVSGKGGVDGAVGRVDGAVGGAEADDGVVGTEAALGGAGDLDLYLCSDVDVD
ncbi:hypothetical protein LR48_Vigan09g050500 [Vigna angularis]|uniref:DUF8039 domain-containing protein n=1 Tax=Phaseolus angularis TaxID=3914 RepID=A0A0L9V9U0_PHAAN|nr:hypothetical protein LR48_Vigan09g050500 [Vigna angularis]